VAHSLGMEVKLDRKKTLWNKKKKTILITRGEIPAKGWKLKDRKTEIEITGAVREISVHQKRAAVKKKGTSPI